MGIASLYESGERKQDKGHFRNMVLIARADGVLDKTEIELLKKIGAEIGLTEAEIQDLIKNPDKYSVNPPADRMERFEQIVNLIQMAQVDGNLDEREMNLIEKVALELGYDSILDVDVESILALIIRGEDIEVIIDELL